MWKKFRQLLTIGSKSYREKTILIDTEEYFLREVTTKDIKDLLAIEREVYAGELPWTKSAFLSELHSFSKHLYLLVQYQEKTIGFMGCRIFNKDAHITNIAVLSLYQGKGLGRQLLLEAKKYARRTHCETMSLEVKMSNQYAQKVYRKFGFVSNGIKRNYYDENNEDALEMILYLKEV